MFVDVAFPISQDQVFTYRVKKEQESHLEIGIRVKAPIGKRQLDGIIVKISDTVNFDGRIKYISKIIDETPILSEKLWKLIEWISNYYLTPIGKAATVIPKNLDIDYSPKKIWYVKRVISIRNESNLKVKAPAQYKVLQFVNKFDKDVTVSKLREIVSNPINVCKSLQRKGLVELYKKSGRPDTSFSFTPIQKKIEFSIEQKEVLNIINDYFNSNKYNALLLHGVTGSGKTEVYIKIVEEVVRHGKTVIILLPEIALTPQIAGRLRAVFGNKVGLWHSKLSPSARAWTWSNMCKGEYQVVVGARSAIFAPLKNLGLIVVDEEQETSYKQEEPEPHYNARDVALVRGKIENSKVLLVSATPSLESYYNHVIDKYGYCYLPKRYKEAMYPEVTVVDMIKEQEETGKVKQVISGLLQEKISDRLTKNEQVILLQNRRGFAPIYRCRDCGDIINCPTCSIPLTYHRKDESLKCHFCGFVQEVIPIQCKHCNSSKLYLSGTGTQKVEDIVNDTFPKAKVVRLDFDTISSGKEITKTLQDFSDGKIDILLGTQMIAKGLDFGRVTLVGIINADTGLFLPDFRSDEKVFQLIYQAAGRSGRRDIRGEVIVQTYNADNQVIRYASRLDLKKYYNIMISERKTLDYPPFDWLAKAVFTGKNRSKVEKTARVFREGFTKNNKIIILGPAWCYREKLRGYYRMQIVFKSSKSSDDNGILLHNFIKKNLIREKTLSGVKINIDIDPISLL